MAETSRSTPLAIDRESYRDILGYYLPLPIRTEEDNEKTLSQVEVLMHQESLTTAEKNLMELLIQLIERFEEEHYAFPPELHSVS